MMMKTLLLVFLSMCMVAKLHAAQYQSIQVGQVLYDVIKIEKLDQLELFLKDKNSNRYYQRFSRLQENLPACAQMSFAMNAGMYHADFRPVGLYVEHAKQTSQLNEDTGFGNFFMQPNGVLAWNHQKAVIQTTADYKKAKFNAQFATQSGPMLINNGKINPQFLPNSNSLKIRNGVGIKDNQLYFVISQQRVSFYQFAQFFKQQLQIDQALYLDGSISSLYLDETKRHDKRSNLGPIVAEIDRKACK
ncbi:hypothetical protein AVENLUH13518_01363 [Acinetobacter venetianus]|uniref:Phosphodiester glycosidase domain-containing protein n=2 Tax=Acinetobacter venetianus TaxID=52133 RepID=A0A150HW37_9GAMM|nr:hypothetical protein AVENLUH13518_01363 [Acinetobacter venetianus]